MSPPGIRTRRFSALVRHWTGAHLWWRVAGALCTGALALGASTSPAAAQVPVRPTPPPPASGSVDVEPKDGGPVGVVANGGGNVTFTVTNNRGFTTTYTPSCDGTGVVTSCSTSPDDNFTLDPNESTDVTVGYGVTGTSGSGQVVLHITGIVSDSGWYDVNILAPIAPTLTQPRQNDSVFNRAHCLTASAGVADWSCGDALLMLGTPGYTTLDRARRMTLVYASATAAPEPLVAANVALDPSEPTLTRITAVLSVHDTVRTTATYSPWSAGDIRQLVVGWNVASAPTGAYPYTLTVYAVAGSDSMGSSVSGLLQVVNRKTGNYGAGWEWLGVERLILHQPVGTGQSQILWVDGDGSSKFYHQINSATWIAPSEAFTDTIKFASGEYTRTLPHGVQVVFDSTGRHIRTSNRQTQVTSFYWRSATQLDSVRVPPAGSGGRTFVMHYNGSSLLDSVRVSGRDVAVSMSGGNMTLWHWPDGTAFSFDTATGGRIGRIISPQGDTTILHYAAYGLVDSSKLFYGPTCWWRCGDDLHTVAGGRLHRPIAGRYVDRRHDDRRAVERAGLHVGISHRQVGRANRGARCIWISDDLRPRQHAGTCDGHTDSVSQCPAIEHDV